MYRDHLNRTLTLVVIQFFLRKFNGEKDFSINECKNELEGWPFSAAAGTSLGMPPFQTGVPGLSLGSSPSVPVSCQCALQERATGVLGSLSPVGETQTKLWAPACSLAQPWLLQDLGEMNQQVDTFPSLSLSSKVKINTL